MFAFVQRWRERRWAKQRLLFPYWDGKSMQYADPFKLWRDAKNNPNLNCEIVAPLIDEGKEPESSQFIEATAKLFGLERWDGKKGLTDWEILNTFGNFQEYIEAVKKKYSPGPTSPLPTA